VSGPGLGLEAAAVRIACLDRPSWLAARQEGIGGSDAAAILGLSPFHSPLEVFVDKLGLVEPEPESEAMRWGRILEPAIAERYIEETGRELAASSPYTLLVSRAHPFLRATLDRAIIKAADKPVPAPLELKTTNGFRRESWDEEPPLHVQIQGQHQLLVTGWEWVSYAVLIGGQTFRWVDMPRNEKFIALLRERLLDFWRHVELREPPDAGPDDREVLAALYPHETEETVALPGAAVEWDEARVAALGQIKQLEALKSEAENLLRQHIGAAAVGVLPNGVRYSWRTVHRDAVTTPALDYRQLRRLERRG